VDTVRLQIVYETGQAAARLQELDRLSAALQANTNALTARTKGLSQVTQAGTGHLRGMALAGTKLAHVLGQGNISVTGLASAMGKLAGAGVAGALIVTIINVVNAFQEFKRIVDDISMSIDAMQNVARDARTDVQRLFGEIGAETPLEKAVKRTRDAVAQMRKEAERLKGAARGILLGQAAELEGTIPGMGRRAAGQRAREEGIRLREKFDITDKAKAGAKKIGGAFPLDAETERFNRALEEQGRLYAALGQGQVPALLAVLDELRKHMEELATIDGPAAAAELTQTAEAVNALTNKLQKMERAARLMEDGLFTMADALEDFIITGTFGFKQFLDNILRLLWRDLSGDLISGLLSGLGTGGGSGSISAPTALPAGPAPSVSTNVNFNIQAMDAQGVAQFMDRNAPLIADAVVKEADRSRSIRRRFWRG
jgi:hypothetical protein